MHAIAHIVVPGTAVTLTLWRSLHGTHRTGPNVGLFRVVHHRSSSLLFLLNRGQVERSNLADTDSKQRAGHILKGLSVMVNVGCNFTSSDCALYITFIARCRSYAFVTICA